MKQRLKADADIAGMQQEWLERHRLHRRWMIVETPSGYEVYEHTADSVWPATRYSNKRLAAARLLQLLGIGPVAPQSHSERICIGEIATNTQEG